jgi:hypothetical protein
MHDSIRTPAAGPSTLIAGAILIVATALEIVSMAHHPAVHTADVGQAVRQIAAMESLSGWVHGTLLAFMLLIAYGFSEFALRRGLSRALIRAGAIAYGTGVIVMFGAAMVSGFIIGSLANLTPHSTPVDLQINAQLLTLCRVLNQTWANVGAVAMSAGIALWSVDLLRSAGWPRAIGALGLAVSIVPAFALIFGLLHLDVHGMTVVVVLQALWNVAVGAGLLRARI